MIVTKDVPAGTPPRDAVTLKKHRIYRRTSSAVDEARKAKNPKVSALRITKPQQPPEFSVDARGCLVALIPDFQLDVLAPEGEARGGTGWRACQDLPDQDTVSRDCVIVPGRFAPEDLAYPREG